MMLRLCRCQTWRLDTVGPVLLAEMEADLFLFLLSFCSVKCEHDQSNRLPSFWNTTSIEKDYLFLYIYWRERVTRTRFCK
jgi:hypothetical protein